MKIHYLLANILEKYLLGGKFVEKFSLDVFRPVCDLGVLIVT